MICGLTYAQTASLSSTAVSIPDGQAGIGLDDINFSKDIHKILVPAGHTGKLYLIDPSNFAMTTIQGFTSSPEKIKGQEVGISSADSGEGFVFVADHGTHKLDAVNIKSGRIAASAPLNGDADFVRYVGILHEAWVTEPDDKDSKRIEVFAFKAGETPALTHTLDISVTAGPESLTIDDSHNRAYTNLGSQVAAIDLKAHQVVSQWPNGCEKPRGTAIDKERGFLFVGCGEGKAVVLDVNHSGKQIGTQTVGAGVDLIDYNPKLSHLYVPGSKEATLSVLGVSPKGELSLLGAGQSAKRAHCVAGDDQGNIWVCDPQHGQLLRYKDTFPAA